MDKRKKGFKAWNKGLTKETDERVKNYCEKRKGFKMSKNYKKNNEWKSNRTLEKSRDSKKDD